MGKVGGIGAKLLSKMGWKEGAGLGAKEDGRLNPVQPGRSRKRKTEGLGRKMGTDDRWWEKLMTEAYGAPSGEEKDNDVFAACEGRRCKAHGTAKLARLDAHERKVATDRIGIKLEGKKQEQKNDDDSTTDPVIEEDDFEEKFLKQHAEMHCLNKELEEDEENERRERLEKKQQKKKKKNQKKCNEKEKGEFGLKIGKTISKKDKPKNKNKNKNKNKKNKKNKETNNPP